MDKTDWAILRELQMDARLSYAEIGRRVGLSSPAVQERVRRMEAANIIKAYRAEVNYEALGLPIMAFARLEHVKGTAHNDRIHQIAQSLPQIIACYYVMGQDDYILKIVAESILDLENVLHHFADYGHFITSIIINAPIENRIMDIEQFPNLKDTSL